MAVRAATGSAAAATFAWLACGASAPFVFNSFTIYPEVPAALAAIRRAHALIRPGGLVAHAGLALACGACLGMLPWLSSKSAHGRRARPDGSEPLRRPEGPPPPARRRRVLVRSTAPVALSVAGWMAFHYVIWGSPFLSVVYGTQRAMRLGISSASPGPALRSGIRDLRRGPGPPAWLPGLGGMLWRGGDDRRVAIDVILVFAALLVAVGAFHIW